MIPLRDLTFIRFSDLSAPGLVLPCGDYATGHFLVVQYEGGLLAVSLDEKWEYEVVECAEADQWRGAYVTGVEIRVDPRSIYSLDGIMPFRGSLVLGGDAVMVAAKPKGPFGFHRPILLPVGEMGSADHTVDSIGIAKWEVGKVIDGVFVPLHRVEAKPLKT